MKLAPCPGARADSVFAAGLMRDKCLFVTGGGSGIGLGICLAFARLGAKVGICGRTESKLAKAAEEIRAAGAADVFFARADVRRPEECRAAVDAAGKRWGRIDVFVNNAAGNFMSLAEDVTPNAFQTVIDIDLRGTFHMSQAALPWLRKAAAGGAGATLIAITATLHYTATPFQGHASAAKAGIDALTRTLAAEWAEDRIRVVGIAPGPIAETEGGPTGRVFGQTGQGSLEDHVEMVCPIGRFGTTDDIANAAVFLASPAGSFVTGEILVVDGLQWQTSGAGERLRGKKFIRAAMRKQKEARKQQQGKTAKL